MARGIRTTGAGHKSDAARGAARPAHRPSRRADIVEACLLLLATRPIDDVTVADIAAAADMTSAAIYYHFASKEDILREGVEQFTVILTAEAAARLEAQAEADNPPGLVLAGLIGWFETRRAAATVYFATSAGQSLSVEVIRRRCRIDLIDLFSEHLRRARPQLSRAERGVAAVGLLSVLETASTSWAMQDDEWLTLGPRAFFETVEFLAQKLVGEPA